MAQATQTAFGAVRTAAGPGRRRSAWQTLKRDHQLWIMILPAIVVILIFNYIPMYGIQLAFRDYDFRKG